MNILIISWNVNTKSLPEKIPIIASGPTIPWVTEAIVKNTSVFWLTLKTSIEVSSVFLEKGVIEEVSFNLDLQFMIYWSTSITSPVLVVGALQEIMTVESVALDCKCSTKPGVFKPVVKTVAVNHCITSIYIHTFFNTLQSKNERYQSYYSIL